LNTKERELNTNVLAIAQKNELLSELAADLQQAVRSNDTERIQHLRDVLRKIDVHRRTGEDWKNFQEQLADVHDTFIRALTSKHPSLTAKEVQLASFLKLNLSSKEISQVLSIGVASIEVYRSNLRKKLGLSGGMSLTTYIQSL
jgi:DNA-binding CsgD family transcriptional regulator